MTDLQVRAQANLINEEANRREHKIAQQRANVESRRADIEARKQQETERSNRMTEALKDAEATAKYGVAKYRNLTELADERVGLGSQRGRSHYGIDWWQSIVGGLLSPLKGWLSGGK